MELVTLVVPIFLVLLLGYALRKLGFIDESFAGQLNKIAYYVLLPVLLFTKTASVEPTELLHLPALVGFPVVVALTTGIAALVSIALDRGRRGAFVQVSFRANLAYLGLPIAISAFGERVAPTVAVIVAVGTIANTVLSIGTLRMYQAGETRALERVVGIVKNPLILAIALGLLSATIGIRWPEMVWNTFELLARMSLPAILLVAGFSLSFRNIRSNLAVAGLATAVKLIAMPALAWLVATYLVPTDDLTRAVLVVMAGMPTAIISQTFAREFDADETMTAGIVSFDTILAMVTVPMTILLLQMISNI